MESWFHFRRRQSPLAARRPFTPGFEQLECRNVLAGNVLAFVAGGNLIVTGDNAGAAITVSQPRAGQITLTGDDTTINGLAGPVTFSKVTKDLRFAFGSGDDSLAFDESSLITVAGNLIVYGGKGSNAVATLGLGGGEPEPVPTVSRNLSAAFTRPGSLNVGGDLTILNLAGTLQEIKLINLNVKGDVEIRNLSGAAFVSIDADSGGAAKPFVNTIRGDVAIANGWGPYDEVKLFSINVKGDVQVANLAGVTLTQIDSFAGSNEIAGDVRIVDGHSEIAQALVSNTKIGKDLKVVETGREQSVVVLSSVKVNGNADVQTGVGADTVFVGGVSFGRAFQLRTGDGVDSVFIGGQPITIPIFPFIVVEETDENGVTTRVLVAIQEVMSAAGQSVTFHGDATALLGDGDDLLSLAIFSTVKFKKRGVLDGQNGSNTADVILANLPVRPSLLHFQVIAA